MQQIDVNNIEDYSIFEWIKSDKLGEQEISIGIIEENGMKFLQFLSGGRININLVNEFLTFIGVVPEDKVEDIKNREKEKELQKSEKEKLDAEKEQQKAIKEKEIREDKIKKEKNSFYFDVIDKAKKDTVINFNIGVEFPFISSEKIKMLSDIYGDEFNETLVDYIYQSVSEEMIKNSISNSLKQYICTQQENKENLT